MFDQKRKIILASKSPRRIELLTKAGFDVEVVPANINEVIAPGLAPADVVKKLALQKASAVRRELDEKRANIEKEEICDNDIIVAADTIVYLDGIIGKPNDREDAEKILMDLSGKTHQVYTGVAIIYTGEAKECAACTKGCPSSCAKKARKNARYALVFSERTDVFFKSYTLDEIQDYLDSDEPYDKAGAYAIQGYFGRFIDHIDGDYNNVMGLPVDALIEKLDTL